MTVRGLTASQRWASTAARDRSPLSFAVRLRWGMVTLAANVGVNTVDGKPVSMATFWEADDGDRTVSLGSADIDPLQAWDLFLAKHYGLAPLDSTLIAARMIEVLSPPLALVRDHYTYLIEQKTLSVDPYWFQQQDVVLARYVRALPPMTDFEEDLVLPVIDALAR